MKGQGRRTRRRRREKKERRGLIALAKIASRPERRDAGIGISFQSAIMSSRINLINRHIAQAQRSKKKKEKRLTKTGLFPFVFPTPRSIGLWDKAKTMTCFSLSLSSSSSFVVVFFWLLGITSVKSGGGSGTCGVVWEEFWEMGGKKK